MGSNDFRTMILGRELPLPYTIVCVNCASTDLWGAWVVNHPGLPGPAKPPL